MNLLPWLFLSLLAAPSSYADALSLDAYLGQVRAKHQGVEGAREQSAGANEQSVEGDILTAPSFFADASMTRDASIPQLPIFDYDRLITNTYSFGFNENFAFGLQAKLEYDVLYTNYVDIQLGQLAGVVPGVTSGMDLGWHATTPKLTLTEPLWGGGFGRTTRASQALTESTALATRYVANYAARTALSGAEAAYWALAVARQNLDITQAALERAGKILVWNERRARLGLGDKADVLQSQALALQRKLDYQTALDDEETGARAFNSARGVDNDQVPEQLQEADPELVARLEPPQRAELRDDVKAAREQTRQTAASSDLSIEKDQPTLNVFASYALNGRADPLDQALGDPFVADRPTENIGLVFQMPLDFSVTKDAREGWAKQRAGAELVYDRKLFEQEETWKDLSTRLSQARHRLVLALAIESAQLTKLEYERIRLEKGRTTTYQVLLFEQDYASAQLGRLSAEGTVLGLLAQMKLFEETPI